MLSCLGRRWNRAVHGHEYFRGWVWAYLSPGPYSFAEREDGLNAVYLRLVERGHCDHVTTLCSEPSCIRAQALRYWKIDLTASRAGKRLLKELQSEPWFENWKPYFEGIEGI